MITECTTMEEVIEELVPHGEYIPALKEGDILKTNGCDEVITFHIEHISPMIFGDRMCTVYFAKKGDNGGITTVGTTESNASGRVKITDINKIISVNSNEGRIPLPLGGGRFKG